MGRSGGMVDWEEMGKSDRWNFTESIGLPVPRRRPVRAIAGDLGGVGPGGRSIEVAPTSPEVLPECREDETKSATK